MPKHTAALIVKVYPIGKPGYVQVTVTDLGPEKLSRREAAAFLRDAARQMEEIRGRR